MEWYYLVDGQQAGPVDDETFRQWIVEGRIRPDQLVWREGMDQWQAAAAVPGLFSPPPAGADYEDAALAAPPTGGSCGRAGVGELLSRAGRIVRRHFFLILVTVFLVAVFNTVPNAMYRVMNHISPQLARMLGLTNLLWTICIMLPLFLGTNAFSLRLVCDQPVRVGTVFSGFRMYGKAIGLQLWMALLVLLWSLLLIVPGIIAALRYSQAMYLICYHPNLGINDAIKASSAMMQGHKLRLFCLGLVFLLIGMVAMAPLWTWSIQQASQAIEQARNQQNASPGEVQEIQSEPVPLWIDIWCIIAGIFLQMFSWMAMAEFHRDLTPPALAE